MIDREEDPQNRGVMPDRNRDESVATARDRSDDLVPIELRGHTYRLSSTELAALHDIGRFRTLNIEDLAQYGYQGHEEAMRRDLRSLKDHFLIELRTAPVGRHGGKVSIVALTKAGRVVAEKARARTGSRQKLYRGFVKPREARHDAAIYRMYQAEREKIEKAGGQIRRIVLDYELKQKVYSPLAKAKKLAPTEYARRQRQVAEANGLKVVRGKIPLPDLRIEYETASGEVASIDLELATAHYRPSHMSDKAAAGFKFYAADGSGAHLSRVLEEREITASIFSL